MIELTTKIGGEKIYINPFWIELVGNDNGTTRIWTHTDNDNEDNPYAVAESVEEVIKKIEDDRG